MGNVFEEGYGSSAQKAPSGTTPKKQDTIGDWTVSRLIKFVQDAVIAAQGGVGAFETVIARENLVADNNLVINNSQATVGAAGGAPSLPATPVKYLRVVDDAGNVVVIPAYNP